MKNNPQLLFEELFSTTDGYAVSKQALSKLSYYYVGLTYGEITFEGFSKILAQAEPKDGEVFYDLGSGSGKAVILASLLYNFSKAVGIELLEDLHNQAVDILNNYFKKEHLTKNVQFLHSNFHKIDFSDADIVFINSSCMWYEIDLKLMEKLIKLKKGTRIITTSYPLNLPMYKMVHSDSYPFSWGDDTAFIHLKVE